MAQTESKLTGRTCKCSGCGEHFTTPGNFDSHRKGSKGVRYCVPPESVGLEIKTRQSGTVWGKPGRDEAKYRA